MYEFMQTLAVNTVNVPAHEILVVLVLQSLCYLFRTARIGLLVSYTFVYRLGWSFMLGHFGLEGAPYFYAYGAFGALMLLLAFWGMIHDNV
ncbi:MAG: hypothetical protein EPN23_03765 [Verrucomicrobia bacterium]|nr:MAG: hypothetical protein EPN23_03765 [Verrucomicrobiota bacterium]